MRKNLILLMLLLLIVGSVAAQGDPGTIQIAQWASSAEATSEYTDDAWSAMRATGEPDVLSCEDNANGWASAGVSGEESLLLTYEQAVVPTQINIYQNYNSGTITGVAIVPADGGDPIPIRNSADPGGECPVVLSVNLPGGLPETNQVLITLDLSELGDWNEIDAVELVGRSDGDPSETMPTSLDMMDYSQYNYVASGSGGSTSSGGDVVPPSQTGNTSGTDTTTTTTDPTPDFGGEWGTSVSCPNGVQIDNGVEVTIIQQRPGSTYHLTAIGLNGFDPVMAVTDEFGNIICNDDDRDAATYSANLPTTGAVAASSTSSQIRYSVSGNNFANISIIVGGYGGSGGEFVLIVEGMISSSADGAGDPFSLYASPALLMSGVDPTAYMISVVSAFDPLLYLVDGDYNAVSDSSGNVIGCDDAGSSNLCWTDSPGLTRSYVSRTSNRQLGGGRLDAQLTVPLEGSWGGYINYMMTGNNSYGDYVAAFHLGTAQR